MTTTVIRTIPLSASALAVYFGTFERLLAYLLFYIDVKDAIIVLVARIAAKLASNLATALGRWTYPNAQSGSTP